MHFSKMKKKRFKYCPQVPKNISETNQQFLQLNIWSKLYKFDKNPSEIEYIIYLPQNISGTKNKFQKKIISNKMLLIALLNWLSHDVWKKIAGKYAISIKSIPYQPTYMGLWTAIQILIWDILSFSYKYKYDQAKFLGIFFPKNAVSKALCFGFRRSQNRSLTSWSLCCCFLVFPNNKWFLLMSFLLFYTMVSINNEMCQWHFNKVTEVNLKAITEDECLFYSSWNSYLLSSLFPPTWWCFNCSSANEELFNIKNILKK